MSGLIANLLAGTRALTTHSKGVEIAGKNLANVSNPDYARQRLILGDRGSVATPLGAESLGVEAMGILQIRDAMLDAQIVRQSPSSGAAEAASEIYRLAQEALGQGINRSADSAFIDDLAPDAVTGISEKITSFFNAFRNLAALPKDTAAREQVLTAARGLTSEINEADARLASLQIDVGMRVAGDVEKANTLIDEIARLNHEIGRFEFDHPGGAVDLRDQRQAKIEDLSKLLAIEVRTPANANGQVQLITRDAAGGEIMLVDRSNAFATVAWDGTNLSAGVPAAILDSNAGSIAGQVTASQGFVQSVRDDLAGLSQQLASAVNAAYNPAGSGSDLLQAAAPPALLELNPVVTSATLVSSTSSESGANDIALAVAALDDVSYSAAAGDAIDGTFQDYFTGVVSRVGTAVASSDAALDMHSTIENMLRSRRDAVSGVSMDEELTDMIKFQRAFEASARFVNVVDELLDLVVNRLGK